MFEKKKIVNEEMKYNGSNMVLYPNPADLNVYRKTQHRGNTTPAGVAQPSGIVHFYKHLMPPASLLPPKNRGRLLTADYRKETASPSTGLQPHLNALKGQVNSALGSAQGMECSSISIAPRSIVQNSNEVAWGITVGFILQIENPPRLNDEVGQALIPPLQRGTKKLQQLSFGLNILNRTKITHYSILNTQY